MQIFYYGDQADLCNKPSEMQLVKSYRLEYFCYLLIFPGHYLYRKDILHSRKNSLRYNSVTCCEVGKDFVFLLLKNKRLRPQFLNPMQIIRLNRLGICFKGYRELTPCTPWMNNGRCAFFMDLNERQGLCLPIN